MVISTRCGQVYGYQAGLSVTAEMRGARQRLRDNARCESKMSVVDHGQRFIKAVNFDYTGQRCKHLFLVDTHIVSSMQKNARTHVKTIMRHLKTLATTCQLCAFRLT